MIGTNILNLRVTFSAGMCVLVCVYVGKSMERKKETIAIEVTFILFPTCVFSIHFFMSSVIVVWCASGVSTAIVRSIHFHAKHLLEF